MSHKKNENPGDPKPLNFDQDVEKGPSDHLKRPFTTPEDRRGDDENEQYYQEEEALSPEEVKLRKTEGNI